MHASNRPGKNVWYGRTCVCARCQPPRTALGGHVRTMKRARWLRGGHTGPPLPDGLRVLSRRGPLRLRPLLHPRRRQLREIPQHRVWRGPALFAALLRVDRSADEGAADEADWFWGERLVGAVPEAGARPFVLEVKGASGEDLRREVGGADAVAGVADTVEDAVVATEVAEEHLAVLRPVDRAAPFVRDRHVP